MHENGVATSTKDILELFALSFFPNEQRAVSNRKPSVLNNVSMYLSHASGNISRVTEWEVECAFSALQTTSPFLFSILIDGALNLNLDVQFECLVLAYADDLVIGVPGDSPLEAQTCSMSLTRWQAGAGALCCRSTNKNQSFYSAGDLGQLLISKSMAPL